MNIRLSGWLVVGFLVSLSGCGGAPAEQSTVPEKDETGLAATPAAPVTPAAGKTDEKKPVPEDPTATQAAAFCANEVEVSAVQPGDQLDKKQINACLVAIRRVINQDCGKGTPKEIVFKIIIDKTGVVTGAFPVGQGSDSPEAACIAEKVKAVTFPAFIAVPQQIIEKYPFKITP